MKNAQNQYRFCAFFTFHSYLFTQSIHFFVYLRRNLENFGFQVSLNELLRVFSAFLKENHSIYNTAQGK
jgi:hypothetical protein